MRGDVVRRPDASRRDRQRRPADAPRALQRGPRRRQSRVTDVATLSRELDTEPFEPPSAPVDEHAITADLRGVRGFALGHARSAGLSGKALQDIFLAVQEVAANLVAPNDTGSLRAWTEQETLVFELRGAGEGIDDPLVGRLADPALIAEPRGLWLARLLCDVVEARTEDGTLVVRLRVALDGPD